MQLGIDRIINEPEWRQKLKGQWVALCAHPASVTSSLTHSLEALLSLGNLRITAAFGPQHGMRGEKQDNMMETSDYKDPTYQIPIFSLYGKVRRPTSDMMETFDVLLVDLQDVGTRIYTFLTTLRYLLEACEQHKKSIWILDRPNPAGRPVEGMTLLSGWESFVGAGELPMRHGLTLGEAALWFHKTLKLNVDLNIIKMKDYFPNQNPGWGWPKELSWVNPSPNAATVSMTRTFPGTVLIEGTTLSEGRGTTHPLELVGAPDLDARETLKIMNSLAPEWLRGCRIRECFFEPTFQKHQGRLCHGFQIHVEEPFYQPENFKPYRLIALWLKAIRQQKPDYPIWRDFPYEYEFNRLAIDLINGGPGLREWVDNPNSSIEEFEKKLLHDENKWLKEREPFLIY